MTQEEKQLLLADLCARLPYGVICNIEHKDMDGWKTEDMKLSGVFNGSSQQYFTCEGGSAYSSDFKPYLRPISSMTEQEKTDFGVPFTSEGLTTLADTVECVDWLNAHHFDYRGLIPMGLALEAPDDMYK